MYADSKTKEPLVLELYRARGAAASWRRSLPFARPMTVWNHIGRSEGQYLKDLQNIGSNTLFYAF